MRSYPHWNHLGKKKESHFFTKRYFDDNGKVRDINLYDEWYSQENTDKKCWNGKGRYIDGTPAFHDCGYFFRLHSFYPPELHDKLQFIAILREPVSRDWSGFSFGLTHVHHFNGQSGPIHTDASAFFLNKKHESFFTKQEMDCTHDMKSFNDIFRGKYSIQLEEFLKYFDRKQLLILNADASFTDPNTAMNAVQKFLNLPQGWNGAKFPWENHPVDPSLKDVKVPKLRCKDRDALINYYAKWNNALYKFVNGTKGPPMEPVFAKFKVRNINY